MSLHFDVAVACDLKPDMPQQVIDTLAYMTRTHDYEFHDPPANSLFQATDVDGKASEDWRDMLQEPGTRFPGEAGGRMRRVYRYTRYGVEHYRYTVSFRQEVLDDSFFDYIALVQWLAPYSETEGLIGYFRSDYCDHPTLLYIKQGHVYMSEITQTPVDIATGAPWPAD